MRRFGILIGATILLSHSTAVAASTWQLERQVEGFTNTQSVTAFVKSENAKFMLRCENKDRIMAMFQPEGIISEAGHLLTRYDLYFRNHSIVVLDGGCRLDLAVGKASRRFYKHAECYRLR